MWLGLTVSRATVPDGVTRNAGALAAPAAAAGVTVAYIWNRDRLYEIMDFGTYMYVPICTEYIPVRNAENGTYLYVPVCT
jgi:hypothetical protein